jgi:voltage-gated potassium channel
MHPESSYSHPPEIPGEHRRRLIKAIGALLCILSVGVGGLMWIEGWDFWRAFFFTLITVTTVGYGDEGISDAGERFATLLLVGGIGMASYTFALVVQTMVTNQFAWKRRMHTRINKLEDHVLVCGFGRMGRTICEELLATGTPFVVIELDVMAATEAIEMGFAVVQGSAIEDEVLIEAGIERATHMVCATDQESENIVATLSARQLRSDITIIARAERPEEIRKLRLAGATRTVAPFHLGGIEIANAITRPRVAEFLASSVRAESEVGLAEITISAESPLVGRSLADCGSSEASHISFVTLERPGETPITPPRGTLTLEAGDFLIVAGDPDQIRWMRDAANMHPAQPESVGIDPDGVPAALPANDGEHSEIDASGATRTSGA